MIQVPVASPSDPSDMLALMTISLPGGSRTGR